MTNIGKTKNLTLISGPCAIESEDLCLKIAEHMCEITDPLPICIYLKHHLIS